MQTDPSPAVFTRLYPVSSQIKIIVYEKSRNLQQLSRSAMLLEGAWFYDRRFLPLFGVLLSATPIAKHAVSFQLFIYFLSRFLLYASNPFLGGTHELSISGLLNVFFFHLIFLKIILFFTIKIILHIQHLALPITFHHYMVKTPSLPPSVSFLYNINLRFLPSVFCSPFSTHFRSTFER